MESWVVEYLEMYLSGIEEHADLYEDWLNTLVVAFGE